MTLPTNITILEKEKFVEVGGRTAIRIAGDIQITAGDKDKINSATDLVTDLTYLEQGLEDERINTINYSSSSLGLSYLETFNYGGIAGNFYLTSITTS